MFFRSQICILQSPLLGGFEIKYFNFENKRKIRILPLLCCHHRGFFGGGGARLDPNFRVFCF